ncbi:MULTISPECIES: DUF397 domain-containing protein [unclassified Crossiella]|uniref:DUF397 domain-containing protein n=1 Tax=Crossiella sp. SN42 TaxID=2944808 RepID=UPI00207CBEAF|nr:DUF397 domain-containing protein [Crossiella sp. SN42]MCO1578323.1 DUF397 domain-containing protein [Crossiella sp. SN42]
MLSSGLSYATWRTSSRSSGNGGQCVEVAIVPDVVGVRDSKNASGPALVFTPDAWGTFQSTLRAGSFDLV